MSLQIQKKNIEYKILKESVEYYIKKPVNAQYLYYTIKNLGKINNNK